MTAVAPEDVMVLLAHGAPDNEHAGQLALTRSQIARALHVRPGSPQLLELLRSMASAGYLVADYTTAQPVYALGQPLDPPRYATDDGDPHAVAAVQAARRPPAGARPVRRGVWVYPETGTVIDNTRAEWYRATGYRGGLNPEGPYSEALAETTHLDDRTGTYGTRGWRRARCDNSLWLAPAPALTAYEVHGDPLGLLLCPTCPNHVIVNDPPGDTRYADPPTPRHGRRPSGRARAAEPLVHERAVNPAKVRCGELVRGLPDRETASTDPTQTTCRECIAARSLRPGGQGVALPDPDAWCTYRHEFTAPHRFHGPTDDATFDQNDEYERCGRERSHEIHITGAEQSSRHYTTLINDLTADRAAEAGQLADAWLAALFEFENCPECCRGADNHTIEMSALGQPFARCRHSLGDDFIGWLHSTPLVNHDFTGPNPGQSWSAYQAGKREYATGRLDQQRAVDDPDYRAGVVDEYVLQRTTGQPAPVDPGVAWTAPQAPWTAASFAGFPEQTRDEAEEAWRHRVDRIDHDRRAGRLTDAEATALLQRMSPSGVILEEQAWSRNQVVGRFDPVYTDAAAALWEDADRGDDTCRHCRRSLADHQTRTGADGMPRLGHPPWDDQTGEPTYYDQHPDPANLIPGDPINLADGRTAVFEYLDDAGTTATITVTGHGDPIEVPATDLRTATTEGAR